MNTEFKVGITNQGDPSLDYWWVDRLKDMEFAIVVSKGADKKFEDVLLDNRKKIIYHATCTGLAGTPIEQEVPSVTKKFEHLKRLIDFGFPKEQIVVRVDPLFPLQWVKTIDLAFGISYLDKLSNILMMTEALGIKRVRYSYINLYDFVLSKLQQLSPNFIIDKFWKPIYEFEIQLDKMNPNLEYEACAEFFVPKSHQVPCLSDKDLKVMDLYYTHKLTPKKKVDERNPCCHCPTNKLELMTNNHFECKYDCKYCYFKPVKLR